MIIHGDFYWIPVLPKELRNQPKGADYKRLRSAFTASKEEYVRWAYRDRHRLMTKTAKAVLAYLTSCLNFETGRCDPSQKTIADELGMGLRSVERAIRNLSEAGWIGIFRRGKTTTNCYRFRVAAARIDAIQEDLTERKKLRREADQAADLYYEENPPASEINTTPPVRIGGSHRPELAGREPPVAADKPKNRTSEVEPLNKKDINQREGTYDSEVGDRGTRHEQSPVSAEIIDILPRLPSSASLADRRSGEAISCGPPLKQARNDRGRLP